jgi:hypothetical protein
LTKDGNISDLRLTVSTEANRQSSIVNLLIEPAEVRGVSGCNINGDDFRNQAGDN